MDVRMLSRIRAWGRARMAEIRGPNRLGRTSVAWAAAWVTTVAVAAVVSVASVGHRRIGLALGAVVLTLGIFAADPLLLVVLALPGSILIQRLGGSTNFSAADLLAFVGGVVALFHVRWSQARYLRQFLSGVVWYQAILILVVIAHPNRYNIVEWFHRFSYLGATVLCGWVIATYGRTRQASASSSAGHRCWRSWRSSTRSPPTSIRPSGRDTRRTPSGRSCGWQSWSPRSTHRGPA